MIAADILLDGLFAAIAAIGFGAVSDPPRPQGGSERAQGPAGAAEADIAAAMRAAGSL